MKVSQDLHQNWQFHYPAKDEWLDAVVPGCVHKDLLRHDLIPDPFWSDNEFALRWIEEQDWTYRTTFTANAELFSRENLELVAEGLDTLATVKLNGVEIGKTANMFVGYRWPVKNVLREGDNDLEITFASNMPYIRAREDWQPLKEANDPVGGASRIRKMQCEFGWDWGPRLVTCGVWLPLRLEAWDNSRIAAVRVNQKHTPGQAEVSVALELTGDFSGVRVELELSRHGNVVATSTDGTLRVQDPQLWWPAGLGDQPLYDLRISLYAADGRWLDTATRRIGLRNTELVRERNHEELGESFYFRVNGRAVFAKGGNWIPAHSFVAGLTRADYEPQLRAMVDANMNTIRVWGGGIYEHDVFYDLCDELGLLIWQDFMFSCANYPGMPEFIDLVREEAKQQVQRIQHHAALALWCGNNEIPYMGDVKEFWAKEPHRRGHYAQIFHDVLPKAVEAYDSGTTYWPSSPYSPPELGIDGNEGAAGDVHFWGVWHSRQPVQAYEKLKVRFCSEFGMQSYCTPETTDLFCPPDQQNPFSPAMECHQKNGGGNSIIMHYVAQRYRFPKDFRTLSYLSQLNQAYCMKVGVEHLRYCMPYTMGATYWQINDCWPVASWSSIEFGGRWKALHHEARRFFAPALAYLRIHGDVKLSGHNLLENKLEKAELYAIYDGKDPRSVIMEWSVRLLDGTPCGESGSKEIWLEPVTSKAHHEIALADIVAKTGGQAFLQLDLRDPGAPAGAQPISRQTYPLTLPRYLQLVDPALAIEIVPNDNAAPGEVTLKFTAQSLTLAVMLWLREQPLAAYSDNYFDLRPGEPYQVTVQTSPPMSAEDVLAKINVLHLQQSYL